MVKYSFVVCALFAIAVSADPAPIANPDAAANPVPFAEAAPSGGNFGFITPHRVIRQASPSPSPSSTCGETDFVSYTVVSGDTLSSIADKYHSGICDIAKLNNIPDPNTISVGEKLTIPENCSTPDNTSCLTPVPTDTCTYGVASTYVVKSGDTLYIIANNFNITLSALEADNSQIANFDAIDVGQLINIPICPGVVCCLSLYTIQSGDTFNAIAQTYGTTLGQIEGLNNNAVVTNLQIGQVIVVPKSCELE